MKKAILIIAFIAFLFTSCSDKGKEEMLNTVPDYTGCVIVVDLKNITKELGEDGIKQLETAIAKKSKGYDLTEQWEFLLSDEANVNTSAPLIGFEYKNAFIYTFYVKNSTKFKEGLEKKTGDVFKDENGIGNLKNTVFMKDKQVWFAPSYPEISSTEIAVFASLKEDESILSNESAAEAVESGNDISTFLNLDKILSGSWNQKGRLIMNLVFDDASYVTGHTNFKDGKVETELNFLNNKGKPAPFSLPVGKINTGNLKEFTAKGNLAIALAVTPETVHGLIRQFKPLLPLTAEMQETLEKLEGDVIFSLMQNYVSGDITLNSAMMTFQDKNGAENGMDILKNILRGEKFRVYADGKKLYVSADAPYGEELMPDNAEKFKGASMGVIIESSFFPVDGENKGLEGMTIMLVKEGSSAKINIEILTEGDRNSLSSLVNLLTLN